MPAFVAQISRTPQARLRRCNTVGLQLRQTLFCKGSEVSGQALWVNGLGWMSTAS